WARMPAMKHGDVHLYETLAITRYVDEAFDGPALQPDSPLERAVMTQWISVVNGYLFLSAVPGYLFKYLFPKTEDGKPDRAAIDAAVPQLEHDLKIIEAAYGKSEWLAGSMLSLADFFVMPLVASVSGFPEGQGILEGCPNLRRALSAMEPRDAYKAAQPQG
ncbi:MAG: glutathione S-transferase family protein, partial [Myxococcota bacterium]